MKQLCMIVLVFVCSGVSSAQDTISQNQTQKEFVKLQGDAYFSSSIPLNEVVVFADMKFQSTQEIYRYLLLKRRTIKVYPYAKLAAEKLTSLQDSISQLSSNRKKKKYTKQMQKYIEGTFSDELKKLTRSEGQILVKLIFRQTGSSSYDLVKDLRSGWRAFWYSTTARMFKISLKEEFHPDLIQEDYLIEDILQRAFMENKLEYQASALNYDFAKLYNKWKTEKKSP